MLGIQSTRKPIDCRFKRFSLYNNNCLTLKSNRTSTQNILCFLNIHIFISIWQPKLTNLSRLVAENHVFSFVAPPFRRPCEMCPVCSTPYCKSHGTPKYIRHLRRLPRHHHHPPGSRPIAVERPTTVASRTHQPPQPDGDGVTQIQAIRVDWISFRRTRPVRRRCPGESLSGVLDDERWRRAPLCVWWLSADAWRAWKSRLSGLKILMSHDTTTFDNNNNNNEITYPQE